ncbi:ytbE, partial [Symbiodinium necroappetens]
QYSWGCFDEASHACQCTVSERACDTAAGKFWAHECWSCCHGSAWGCFVPGNGPESGCHCNLYEGACALDFPDATWSHQCFECEEDSVQKDAEAAMDDGGVGVAVAVSVSVTVVVIAACIGIYCLWAKMRKPKPVNEPYNSPQFNQSDVVVGLAVSGSAPSPAWEVLEGYHAKGVLKAIGVSNFNKSALDWAVEFSAQMGKLAWLAWVWESLMKTAKVKPAVNQIELNVLEYDAEALAYAESLNITVEAYSPVGRSGHSGDISGNKVIQGVAANHNISTYQVALKWIVQHGRLLTFQSSSSAHQA